MKRILNPAQQAAVDHDGGHLLIAAGPGTGKTHTLVGRIARISKGLTGQQRILAITFTNKAAVQLNERLAAWDVPSRLVNAVTFHAFCLKLLRDHWDKTSLPKDFRIASEDDLKSFDKSLLDRISYLKNTALAIESDADLKQYTRILRQNNLIDLDDVLREALELLEDEETSCLVAKTYPYIFVDEYQDINIVQNALLKRLVGSTGKICAIGDPNQSIYGFRGSDVRLFDRFKQDFAGAAVLKLSENFRSAPNLLTASVQVISKADTDMELLAQKYSDGKLIIHEADSDRAEADFVAGQIERMVGGLNMQNSHEAARSLGDIAVLYRLNTQRHAITQALDHLGIPYQVSKKPARGAEYSDESALCQKEEELEYTVEKVSLLTLHAAKGLEFPVVFMVGCEERLLPLDLDEMRGDAAEERRLFFVGMTRAKEALYLTYAKRRQLFGRTMHLSPSPFLSDIEEQLKVVEAARKKHKKAHPADDGQMQLF